MSSHKERGERDEEESFFSLRSKENVHISCKWNQRRKKNKIKSFSAKNFLSTPRKNFKFTHDKLSPFSSLILASSHLISRCIVFFAMRKTSLFRFTAVWRWSHLMRNENELKSLKCSRNIDGISISSSTNDRVEREKEKCAIPSNLLRLSTKYLKKKRKTLSFEFSSAEKFRCSRRREREGLVYEVPYFVAQMKYSTRRNFPRPPAGGRSRTTMKARRRRPEREREKKNSNRIC